MTAFICSLGVALVLCRGHVICEQNMKYEFKFKNRYIHCYQFETLRLKLLKNKEKYKKICHICHHNFKNIPCYVMKEVSLKWFYFVLFDEGLTLKTLKLAFIGFWIQTLHMMGQLNSKWKVYRSTCRIIIHFTEPGWIPWLRPYRFWNRMHSTYWMCRNTEEHS